MVENGVLSLPPPPPPPPKSSDGCIHGVFVNEDKEEKRKQADLASTPTPECANNNNNNNNNNKGFWLPSTSSSLKPFLDGGLTELLRFSIGFPFLYLLSNLDRDSHLLKQALFPSLTYAKLFKTLPSQELILVTSSTLRFGMYENLTRGVETYNKGSPLSIYQQVCCGLTTGSVVACIATPIELVCTRMRFQATFTEIYQNLYRTARGRGILSLWRGGSLMAHARIAMNTGMLASYDRSFNYFRGSLGLTETKAILGAGAVSSIFASACFQPFVVVQGLKNSINLKDGRRRYHHISSLDIALEVLKQRGPLAFFRGLGNRFSILSPHIMWSWYVLEVIRKFEYLEKKSA